MKIKTLVLTLTWEVEVWDGYLELRPSSVSARARRETVVRLLTADYADIVDTF
jgi:hypothetical protein